MFCKKCGKEIPDNSLFCTFCGTEQTETAPVEQSCGATVFHSVCASNDFHLLTIFYLVSACASFLASIQAGVVAVPIIQIFVIIALFKLEKLAKANAPLAEFASPLKTFRIIIKIFKIFCWIAAIIIGVCGVITLISGGAFAGGVAELAEEILNEANLSFFGSSLSVAAGITLILLGIIFIVAAVITAVLNVFMYGSFYKTAESAELSAKTGDIYIASVSKTRAWLIVSAVLSGISALSTLGTGAEAVLGFVGAGFQIAFIVFAIKTLDNIKNYRQNGIL